ncbi:MAG TPA: DEAD/DEAH box helicase, partial [Candidatus Thermoplasmatota archaeon]|nr:DEAD/DEAH box helicase [Candidatus Thermoplasmatota archaeon]
AAEALARHGYQPRADGGFVGPVSTLPALASALALAGVRLEPGASGWPAAPAEPPTPAPLFPDDPRRPLAREGLLDVRPSGRVGVRLHPENSVLPRSLRVELYRHGWIAPDGRPDAPVSEAGRLVALLRHAGFDVRWPKPTSSDWRLASVRYSERPRRDGGGTMLHLKGPLALGRMGGMDPAAETARIAWIVRGMEESLRARYPEARPLAHGALPGLWTAPAGAGEFLVEAALKGASVTPAMGLDPVPVGRGVVLVDSACLPPRLMEFRRAFEEDDGPRRPVATPEIEAVVRRVVPEGLEVDADRGHYLVPSTRLEPLLAALREAGAKVLQRRLAPRGKRYARWEPRLPEDETGARPKPREPFRGRFEGEVPGLRPECALDPHQREGIAFILHHGHSCLLADEMGLGKTLTAIASAQFLPGRVLVVCPASARGVWKQEVLGWTTERVRVLLPSDPASSVLEADRGEKYVVVAYSGLSKFADDLARIPFDLVVLDESHYVKSRSAQRTRLVEEKLRAVPRRLILSGTPVMNEPREVRTQLAFVHPDEWSDTAWFNRRFQLPWKHGTPEVKAAVLARLREHLEGVMLRREKREALPDLPEKQLRVHRLALPPEARRAYDEQEDSFRDYMQEHEETALAGGMARTAGRLEALKQAALVGKLPQILDAARATLDRGEKLVLFCHYREPIAAIAKELAPYGVVTLTGSTLAEDRERVVRRFQEDDDVRVFVGQTVAAGVAVTLTAARQAAFCDLEWNPALHRQAMDRVHRKTQTRDVEVHFFLAEDTVEEDIAEVLEEKTEMMDMLLEGRKGGSFGLRDKEAAQREVALRILSRRRRLSAGKTEED